jgi:hypothetical protein
MANPVRPSSTPRSYPSARIALSLGALLIALSAFSACGSDRVTAGSPPAAASGGGADGGSTTNVQNPGHPPPSAGATQPGPAAGTGGATLGTGQVAASIDPVVIDQTGADNPAGLSPAEVTQLIGGGPLADMKWLYPYEGTVFPGGTIAPLVMWTGNPAPDAVYLHMKSQAFEYKGVLKPAIDGALFIPSGENLAATAASADTFVLAREANKQLAIPQKVWEAAGQHALGKGDSLLLEVTERANGQIHGPVVSRITIARGALQGSVYYNTCWSGTDSSDVGIGSMVMRIPSGGNAQPVSTSTQCIGCHSVSADG